MTSSPASPEAPIEPSRPDGPRASAGQRYVFAWLALIALTLLSFGADQLHLGSLSAAIALGVALLKAGVVCMVFMHLGREPFPVRFIAGLNLAWVLLLCLGIAADVSANVGPPRHLQR